jgi:lipopolysaccharide/colanic/teichoic acid biosynthesis glycosyltransferase
MLKRTLDLTLATIGLLLTAPLLLAVAAAARGSGDTGPFFYRATRIGRGGRHFTLWKVRTMAAGASGPGLTTRSDRRITQLGRPLRRLKIDELPQLWNVIRGDMSLVGPRPEDERYVNWSDPLHRKVFSATPGITGLAQLEYRSEETQLSDHDTERTYRETILPAKLALDSYYLDHQSMKLDLKIIGRTLVAVLDGARRR